MPHGRASDKPIQSGELVTIDFGAVRGGYHSDETVTVAIGSISDRQRRIYETVLEARATWPLQQQGPVSPLVSWMPWPVIISGNRAMLITSGMGWDMVSDLRCMKSR